MTFEEDTQLPSSGWKECSCWKWAVSRRTGGTADWKEALNLLLSNYRWVGNNDLFWFIKASIFSSFEKTCSLLGETRYCYSAKVQSRSRYNGQAVQQVCLSYQSLSELSVRQVYVSSLLRPPALTGVFVFCQITALWGADLIVKRNPSFGWAGVESSGCCCFYWMNMKCSHNCTLSISLAYLSKWRTKEGLKNDSWWKRFKKSIQLASRPLE